MPTGNRALLEVLAEAREQGFLGPGPLEPHLTHAQNLAGAIGSFSGRFLDLGSGGGLPGLVLAEVWSDATCTLLDAQQRRCAFLQSAVARLGVDARVRVACGRAERLARDPGLRGKFDLVVARAFASPAVTAECGVGFLGPGGRLVVTEPPGRDESDVDPNRWPKRPLDELGLSPPSAIRRGDTGAVVLTLRGEVDARWPRREGVPAKRPLW